MSTGEEMVELKDGTSLWTVTEGDGRPVVWCHGGPGGTDVLGPVAEMVSDVARVHRHEQRGCGRSSGGPPFTMRRSVDDLDELRRHWGHRSWVVGGHSFGAAVALAYGLEHPDRTEAVIFLSCVVHLDGQPDWHEQYRRARLERMPRHVRARFLELRHRRDRSDLPDPTLSAEMRRLSAPTDFANPDIPPRLQEEQEAELAWVNEEVNQQLGADVERFYAAPALRQRLQTLEVPLLVVHGAADPRPVAAAQALASELQHSRLVVLDGVGHFPHLEKPERLRATLRTFLFDM